MTICATGDRLLISRTEDDPAAADPVLQFVEASAGTTRAVLAELLDAPGGFAGRSGS